MKCKTNKIINYSLQLLRLLLCFWVVIHHSCSNVYKFKGKFHVPTFMIMSFYFYYKTLKTKNITKIKERFQRITIPYIIWAIFIFIFNNIFFKLFGFSIYKKKLLIKELVLQLIFGTKYHFIFYYQFNLILVTILLNIISFLFHKYFIFIFQILLIIAYLFQYTYWNFLIFEKYSFLVRYSLGNILELLPFAVTGVTLCYLDIVTKLKKLKILTILTIFYIGVILFFILEFDIFVRIKGFWFPGILLNIGGICIFILFSLFSFQNKKIIFLLKIITKFTGGIYYIHMLFYHSLIQKFLFIQKRTIYGSIFIYTCYLGNKLLFKTKFKLLFN